MQEDLLTEMKRHTYIGKAEYASLHEKIHRDV
jgi:hypothetical protein